MNNLNEIAKIIQNVDIVIYKLRLALTKITNYMLKIAKKEWYNKKDMVKRQKIETMAVKRYINRERIYLPNKKEKNIEDNTGNSIDSDQVNDKYLLQL